MKTHCPLLLSCLLAALLAGCAGYNNTLFMTKSNIGLDFDAKPPTLEINASRKEAVIAPSFEGGQTPPVMASFRPGAGTSNGLTSFFMGVDQTFAGGDAALAMAKLYGDSTAHDKSKYNSAITLSKAPAYSNCFQRVAGPGETRPLIFGTDTSLGLKVAWSGAGGQIPDTVKLGFNRKEFAWAPLSVTPTDLPAKVDEHGNVISTAVSVKMPAFLATIESHQTIGVGSSSNVDVGALQYFATGDSATYLAMQEQVREAMHARMDPNNQAFRAKFNKNSQAVLAYLLFNTDNLLEALTNNGDATAAGLIQKLNNLEGLELPEATGTEKCPYYFYNNSNPANLLMTYNTGATSTPAKPSLDDIQSCYQRLDRSLAAIKQATNDLAADKTIHFTTAGAASASITKASPQLDQMKKDLPVLAAKLQALQDSLSTNVDVIAAYSYLEIKLSPR